METFEELVTSAAQFTHQLRLLEAGRPKLTAKAFLQAAMEIANIDKKRLVSLEKMLAHKTAEPLRGFVARAVARLRDGSYSYPPDKLNRIRYLGSDEVAGVMGGHQTNYFEMFALAVKICGDRHPEAFGTIENWPAYQAQVRHIRDTVAAMNVMITTEVKGSDLHIVDGGNGTARVTFTLSDGEVSLYPVKDAGERLVNWVLNHPGTVKAA